MKNRFSWDRFNAVPLVGILRAIPNESVLPVVTAAIQGGWLNLEVTLNSEGALSQIRELVARFGTSLNVGAGTVTSLSLLEKALEAGASFIVTPVVQPEVIESCVSRGVPVFPGAFSPTEIERAWSMGASQVKVFPAEKNGPGYLRSLRGPFPHIRLMPTGGVDLETIGDFARAGASGYGIGSPLFRPDRIASQDWLWIEERAKALKSAWKAGADSNPAS